MDRFIGRTPRTVVLINTDLKSNMDRFIDFSVLHKQQNCLYLKSNMYRFIACAIVNRHLFELYLKSNMDRFIDYLKFSV